MPTCTTERAGNGSRVLVRVHQPVREVTATLVVVHRPAGRGVQQLPRSAAPVRSPSRARWQRPRRTPRHRPPGCRAVPPPRARPPAPSRERVRAGSWHSRTRGPSRPPASPRLHDSTRAKSRAARTVPTREPDTFVRARGPRVVGDVPLHRPRPRHCRTPQQLDRVAEATILERRARPFLAPGDAHRRDVVEGQTEPATKPPEHERVAGPRVPGPDPTARRTPPPHSEIGCSPDHQLGSGTRSAGSIEPSPSITAT